MIRSLEHFALSVSSLKRSLSFYRDLLGMKVVFEVEFSNDKIERITGIKGARCKVVHLKLGSSFLELFQYYHPIGRKIPHYHRQCDYGFIHLGFNVTEIHKHIEELKKQGVEFLGELVEIRPGTWVVYFYGPDGEVCEFRQLPE